MLRFSLAIAALPLLFANLAAAAELNSDESEFFEKKIRPVLVRHCYECHSAEAGDVKGGLVLDTRAGIRAGGDSGPAVVPADVDESLLIAALRHEAFEMPPSGRLPAEVIDDFIVWIQRGAPDPRDGEAAVVRPAIDLEAGRAFWAFQPPLPTVPPPVKNTAWPRHEIDRFILARLEAEGLNPVPPAGKRELIRRATFDLIGLPPTPEEIDAFLSDESPHAFARVVDRLLDSPHYGERWGRYWLDVARYAEDQAHTFAVKPNDSGYRYRDWIVEAFNSDMPYDQFVRLQIAADLIEMDEAERFRHLPALGFVGLGAQYYKNTDAARARADELDDRVDTLTRGFLGLTVSCARCHDHKYDPIPTQDYYSLAGVFESSRLANLPLAGQEAIDRYDAGQQALKAREEQLKGFLRDEKTRLAESRVDDIAKYMAADWNYRQLRREKPQASLAEFAKGAELNLGVLERWIKYLDADGAGRKIAALSDWYEQPAEHSADAVAQTAGQFARHVNALLSVRDGVATDEHRALLGNADMDLAKLAGSDGGLDKSQTELLQALFGEKGIFTPSDDEFRKQLTEQQKTKLETLESEVKQARESAPPMYPVAHALAEATPKNMKVFLRGNPAQQGEEAPRRFLRVIAGDEPPEFQQGSGRRELAEAIASPDNPLTARVMVNRIWQHHFGRGLVGTPSNFGQIGERPTHPELLDYLAHQFIEGGWSIKAMHRELMLTTTYQLSSEQDATNSGLDADNRFLWRMNRRRLDVEAWRDALLAVSGRLDPTLGGPSLDLASADNRRRTVYAKISRHNLDSLLRLFDFPDANITSEQRTVTTVPQQQLFVLNSPFMQAQAKALAARLHTDSEADDAERIRRAFLLAYGRPPTVDETELGQQYLSGSDDADEHSFNKLTRWQRYAQVLLGANEFLYID